MDRPFISVIIPTWRESKILNRCLDSLLAQDYPRDRFEIILVSKEDNSAKNEKIKIVKIAKDVNHAEARNIGVAKAKGEIIAFCDDDCILPKDWLLAASSYFIKGKADLIGGAIEPPKNASFAHRVGGYLATSPFVVGFAAVRHKNLPSDREAHESNLILANTFVRKEVFQEIGGFDPTQVPCEENLFYFRLKKAGYKILYATKIACTHQAKPIFLPWARKIFFYATGRGMLSIRTPETFHLQYAIPSIFVLTIVGLGVLSFISSIARFLFVGIGITYGLLSLANAFYIFLKLERNPTILIATPVATFLIHVSYGLGFLAGLLRYLFGKREAVKMPSRY